MCRLYGFHANELTKVECSLVHAQNALLSQSCSDVPGRQRAAGWGISCYGDLRDPCSRFPQLVRHKTAAFEAARFGEQAATMYAQTVVAHVRLATVGYVGSLNAHPFTHDGWTFAHYGTLRGFDRLECQLMEETGHLQCFRLGETDSEQFFLWLLARFVRDNIAVDAADDQAVAKSVSAAVAELDRRCHELQPEEIPQMTFVLTNGRLMVGCRWHNPLHWLMRRGICDCEICGVPHIRHDDSIDYRAVVFASEPITHEAWQEVPEESIITVNEAFEHSVTSPSEGVQP